MVIHVMYMQDGTARAFWIRPSMLHMEHECLLVVSLRNLIRLHKLAFAASHSELSTLDKIQCESFLVVLTYVDGVLK
jgi:hypothetical protein